MYWLVMPAAGKGERMAGADATTPKQYLALAGRRVIEHALAPFLADPRCVGIVVALPAGDATFAALAAARDPRVVTVTGGAGRADSVRAALARVRAAAGDEDPWVLVHDAARPCLPPADLERLLATLATATDGALLGLRVAETVKRADASGRVVATVPREGLWRAATPQAFRLRRLLRALAAAPLATDEASAIEAGGDRPQLIEGSPDNLKLTTLADLVVATRILQGTPTMTRLRIGSGIDVHAFGPGDALWLGGVRVPHGQGVIAHSDGDVLLHALCDALLGAAGLGDIGQHFPDSEARWKGIASTVLLRETLARVRAQGFAVVNADLTLLAEAPKLAPHRAAIVRHLETELGLEPGAVNVKATTTEQLGFLGRREGIAAQATVLIEASA